jgi:hypothetical protein
MLGAGICLVIERDPIVLAKQIASFRMGVLQLFVNHY